MSVQIIKDKGTPIFAVLPYQEYLNLMAKIEDTQDIEAAHEIKYRITRGKEDAMPAHLVRELVNSERPLRVWRRYRGFTLQALAGLVGISKSYLSQIESGRRNGSADVLKRIAAVLDVSLDDIV